MYNPSLVHSYRFSHYSKVCDIQTMAMLSCVFQTYDKHFASILNVDDDDGFTIVPQQAKVTSSIVWQCLLYQLAISCVRLPDNPATIHSQWVLNYTSLIVFSTNHSSKVVWMFQLQCNRWNFLCKLAKAFIRKLVGFYQVPHLMYIVFKVLPNVEHISLL